MIVNLLRIQSRYISHLVNFNRDEPCKTSVQDNEIKCSMQDSHGFEKSQTAPGTQKKLCSLNLMKAFKILLSHVPENFWGSQEKEILELDSGLNEESGGDN